MSTLRMLEHRDPACSAGFSAVLVSGLRRGPYGDDDDLPGTVELRCWTCNTRHTLDAMTPAVAREHDGYDHRASADERGWLSGASDFGFGLEQLPASVPPVKVRGAAAWLHVERRTGFGSLHGVEDVYEWLVADEVGNVLGVVVRYRTARGANRYRCGLGAGPGLRVQGKGERVDVIPLPGVLSREMRPWIDGTQLYAASRDLLVVQRLMRHSSPVTTAGYARVSDAVGSALVDRLP